MVSLGAWIGALEVIQMEQARARSASVVVATSTGDSDDQSHTEMIPTSMVMDQISAIQRVIDSIDERVAVIEGINMDRDVEVSPQATPEGLTAEQAAAFVRKAKEETQSRLIAEMLALEERVDKRAQEEAKRLRDEREADAARSSMRRVSATVSAYTADLATRLEELQADHEKQGTEVARAAEEIVATDTSVKNLGSELVVLGEVANKVRTWYHAEIKGVNDMQSIGLER